MTKIAFIGLGEAAGALISGWGAGLAADIRAYDIKSANPATAAQITTRAEALNIMACASPQEAVQGADLVFSTVTADQAIAAATTCAPFLSEGAVWCDLNSCAPSSKQTASGLVADVGCRYVDVAVMAPVYPKQHMVPCLLSGPSAGVVAPILAALPMQVSVVGDTVGRASSIKMVRSIMVKGLEALTAECALAAVAAGVAEDVFPSLKSGHPQIDVAERAAYNFERSLVHGARRAAEMEEVAKMLGDLGLPNVMSQAAAYWEGALGALDLTIPEGADHLWFVDQILGAWSVGNT